MPLLKLVIGLRFLSFVLWYDFCALWLLLLQTFI
eukprot:UN07019